MKRYTDFDYQGRNMNEIVDYLITGKDAGVVDAEAEAKHPNWLKRRNEGYILFRDPQGYPALTPPWGTLNEIDLNKGEIRWQIPFGEYPELAAQGIKDTGSGNYGGPVVTASGPLFIGATCSDKKLRAFGKLTGKLLQETLLPAAGNATPSICKIHGRQFVVILM
jgi:quinoprotein glucose dehydrogenase